MESFSQKAQAYATKKTEALDLEMQAVPVSVTIITLNEEANIRRVLESAKPAADIVVVDSGSTDRTLEIARSMGARVFENPWPGYGKQKNFAQDQAKMDWVLNVDADEEIPAELWDELRLRLDRHSQNAERYQGYFIPRKTFYLGKWIQYGGWYPNYLVRLANRQKSRWTEPEVHEEWKVEGPVGYLKQPLCHYTFQSISDQVRANLRYAELGAREQARRGRKGSLFRLLIKPGWKFFETYFLKRGFLDGLPGLIISINAAYSMFMKQAFLMEWERKK